MAGASAAESVRRLWIFDLDNTLHDANPHIFPHINEAMTRYIVSQLGLDDDNAANLRQGYWTRYGATLVGLMRHHRVAPRHFLAETHRFPDLAPMLVYDRELVKCLRALPGRKVVFSNAPAHYARSVLMLTGLLRAFEAVYTIERVRFRPKPDGYGFRRILAQEGYSAAQTTMVDDDSDNLATAKRLGMRTVWVTPGLRRHPSVDVCVPSVRHLTRRLPKV